jgi:hypothetical protein
MQSLVPGTSRESKVRLDTPYTLIGLLAIAIVVRGGVFVAVPGLPVGDPDGYRRLAANLVAHGTFGEGERPTAYRPPLYPLLLAPCVALGPGWERTAIATLHVLLGVATVWLTWRLAVRCGLGRWAVVAGGLVACDPILLGQSSLVMTETAAAFFVAVALLALVWATGATAGLASGVVGGGQPAYALLDKPAVARWALAGAALGLCGLCRPEFLLWAAACAGAMLVLLSTGRASRTRVARVGALVAGVMLVLAPWAVRNQIEFGRPIVTTTHGGYTLLLANNPSFYEHLRHGAWGTVWDAQALGPEWSGDVRFGHPEGELVFDARAKAEAWRNICAEPWMFAYACVMRIGYFWQLAPHQGGQITRWVVGACYFIEFVLAGIGLWVVLRKTHHRNTESTETRGRERAGGFWVWGGLLAVSMTAVHAVYWSNMRMRGAAMPVVAVAAATGLAWWRGRRRHAQVSSE